jgi:hypothetical protein
LPRRRDHLREVDVARCNASAYRHVAVERRTLRRCSIRHRGKPIGLFGLSVELEFRSHRWCTSRCTAHDVALLVASRSSGFFGVSTRRKASAHRRPLRQEVDAHGRRAPWCAAELCRSKPSSGRQINSSCQLKAALECSYAINATQVRGPPQTIRVTKTPRDNPTPNLRVLGMQARISPAASGPTNATHATGVC